MPNPLSTRIYNEGFMALTVKDLEKVQQQVPDYRMELVDGVMVEVKSPTESVKWTA
jgi:hypothetical protein